MEFLTPEKLAELPYFGELQNVRNFLQSRIQGFPYVGSRRASVLVNLLVTELELVCCSFANSAGVISHECLNRDKPRKLLVSLTLNQTEPSAPGVAVFYPDEKIKVSRGWTIFEQYLNPVDLWSLVKGNRLRLAYGSLRD